MAKYKLSAYGKQLVTSAGENPCWCRVGNLRFDLKKASQKELAALEKAKSSIVELDKKAAAEDPSTDPAANTTSAESGAAPAGEEGTEEKADAKATAKKTPPAGPKNGNKN